MPSLRLPDIGSQLEPGNPTPGAHTTGALGHASMLAAPASGRVAVLAPRRQARRVVARRVAVARALDGAGDELRDESRGDDRPVDAEARVAAPCLARPGWRTALGTAVSCAALSAGARTPPALAVADAGVGASASVSSRDARADRGASLPAELLARTHAADASRIADVSFLPAAVGIPRTGWFVGSWIAGNAAGIQKQFAEIHTKFLANWVAYCTIPVVAGLLNWMTNSLAVKMIFSPEEYVGLEFRRWPETPAGLFGWQGIVPCKVRKMSTTMVELMTSRLLDVREVFGRLDKKKCGDLLEPGIDEIAAGVAEDLLSPGGALEGWRQSIGCVPLAATWAARDLARRHGKALVAEVLGEMQKRVPEVWDVKEQVVGAMCRDKGIIVELFQRCGRDEFIFIRRSGLYFGFLFGIFQMVQWLVWDPWWSLAVGGAAVGYATNWLALTLMFSPVNPIEFGPFTLHGAFLRRQAEVSVEFAEMLRDRVLTAELIWREILTSERTKGVFAEILERKTREQIRKARAEGGMVALAAGVLGEKAWRAAEDAAATRVLAELPSHLPLVYAYSDEALDLENTLREKMQGLSGEEFEGVLHPVFQEDELTLILVGAFLGLVAGFGQAAFF